MIFFSCSNTQSKKQQNYDSAKSVKDTLSTNLVNAVKDDSLRIYQSDTTSIQDKIFVLTVYKSDTSEFFIVKKEYAKGKFKTIIKDEDYETNNSDIAFDDINNDGNDDIVWTKKWQDHAYLFNPKIENFVEVGEFHTIDTLKINNIPVLYEDRYPILYYWNYEKSLSISKCSMDSFFVENHSELFVISDNYKKISFATLDNFATIDDNVSDTIECGAQIINCQVPPYYGKYSDYSIWNSGKSVDSFYLAPDKSFNGEDGYAIDSSFITNYWIKNYSKLLQYGQVFTVRRERPLIYFK